jgi:DNA-directed RNA polymerase subunit M/transcription elongation factor TFIIS
MDREEVKKLIEKCREEFFIKDYKPTDEEVLGLIVSKYLEWSGDRIVKCFLEALEDSNYHELREKIENLWEEEMKRFEVVEEEMKRFEEKCPNCNSVDLEYTPRQIPSNEIQVKCNSCGYEFTIVSLDFIKED